MIKDANAWILASWRLQVTQLGLFDTRIVWTVKEVNKHTKEKQNKHTIWLWFVLTLALKNVINTAACCKGREVIGVLETYSNTRAFVLVTVTAVLSPAWLLCLDCKTGPGGGWRHQSGSGLNRTPRTAPGFHSSQNRWSWRRHRLSTAAPFSHWSNGNTKRQVWAFLKALTFCKLAFLLSIRQKIDASMLA